MKDETVQFKFNKPGRWADPDVRKPQVQVMEVDVEEENLIPVSPELAEILVDAGHGEVVEVPDEEDEETEVEVEETPDRKTAPESAKAKGGALRRLVGRRGSRAGPVRKSEVPEVLS